MATAAEAELDDRARKIMKANPGIGYPKACSQALIKDPSLYDRYQAELANGGARYNVPEPADYFGPTTD